MVSGESFGGDYFIDSPASRSVGRAIFGAWITICVTVVGIGARSVYHSRLRRKLLINGMHHKSKRTLVSPWVVLPPSTISEVYDNRRILLWALSRREFVFILSSLACIFVAIITAASTAIANQAVVNNVLTRPMAIQGQLPMTSPAQPPLGFATLEMAARIKALDAAEFPVEELLDFVPDDTSGWVYSAADWNNSWRGRCTYSAHRGVDLTIFPTNSTRSQDEVPALSALLPPWVSLNSTGQGPFHSGIGSDNYTNNSIVWEDMLITWVYLGQLKSDIFMFNVSLVNFLVDRAGAYPGGGYVETGFRSDVHIASCGFENANPILEFQATPGVDPEDAVNNIAWVYQLQAEDASLADQPIVQPTGQQMLRYWQAYISILNTQYPHEAEHFLSVS